MLHRFPRAAALMAVSCIFLACSAREKAGEPKATDTSSTAAGSATPQVQGVEIVSDQGKFSIRMPVGFSNPREGKMPLAAGGDTTWMTSYTALRDSATAFIVAYTEVRQASLNVDDAQVFDMAREAALKNINGVLERQESRTLNGHPGRSVFFTGKLDSTTYYGRADFYLAMPRLYQLYYVSNDQGSVTSPSVMASFTSFAIKDSVVQDSTMRDSAAKAP